MEYRILIAEDDKDITTVLKMFLENEGFQVLVAYDGEEALKQLKEEDISLAIVDIKMPKIDGYQVVKSLRTFSRIPVIILSANSADSDKILGLDLGADDYLTKPFNPLEVMARVRSQLRRFYQLNEGDGSGEKIQIGEITLDLNRLMVLRGDREILLTAFEFKILKKLMESPNQIFTRTQIYESVSGDVSLGDETTIMTHISNIRDKLGKDPRGNQYIKTIRGLGYKFEE